MKDKAEAKLEDWQQFKPLVNLLESRPDLVQMIQENITSQVSNGNASISEEDFNPWDAYFMSLDALVDVFVKSKGKERSKSSSSLDAVRAAKNSPRTPGAVPSRGPTPKSEDDKVWEGVMASANAGRLP
jgi:hypothetical protein